MHLRTEAHYCELSKGVPSRSVAVSQSPSQSPFHTGSVFRDSLPLRQVHLAVTLPAGISGTDSSSGSFPHWQHIPQFAAVAVSGRT